MAAFLICIFYLHGWTKIQNAEVAAVIKFDLIGRPGMTDVMEYLIRIFGRLPGAKRSSGSSERI